MRRGSVTAAAKVLYLSQPRLSKILAETEQKYGVAIFKRENNGLTPTEAGRKFLKIARDIVEEAEGKEKLLYNRYEIKKKNFDIVIKDTFFDVDFINKKSSNIEEFFDVIDW